MPIRVENASKRGRLALCTRVAQCATAMPTSRVPARMLLALLVTQLGAACTTHPTPSLPPSQTAVRRLRFDPVFTEELWFADELAPLEDAIAAQFASGKYGPYDVV